MTHIKAELPEAVTVEWLIALGAERDCESLRTFHRTFGGSCAPTRENLLKAASVGLPVGWLALQLLTVPDYQAFTEGKAAVWEACTEGKAAAWEAYTDAKAAALEAYDAKAAALEAYADARAAALKAYMEATARALADLLWPPEPEG